MVNSIRLISEAILLAVVGTPVASFYTMFVVLGVAGAPGALVSEAFSRKSDEPRVSIFGLILTVVGQSYASLAFVALIVLSVRSWVADSTGFTKWILWTVAFFVAVEPAAIVFKDVNAQMAKELERAMVGRLTHCYAMPYTALITIVGFFVFVFFPSLASWGWGWTPHF